MTLSWLDTLVNQHNEFESPLLFWRWSAISAISAVVKDQIWIDRYLYKLYPNIYVMLHAESGLKKGPPVSMANKLVSSINNTKIISGRSSIQGILKEMGTARTVPGGKVEAHSTAFICSSELSSSIVDDPVAAKILTDLYDRQYRSGDWASLLKMETFKLNNPTITMLTATNDAMSQEFFSKSAIQGGYFARTFIIYETVENRSNALMIPPKHIPDYKDSSNYLKELSLLRGEFISTGSLKESDIFHIPYKDPTTGETGYLSDVGNIYQQWYDEFKSTIKVQEVKDNTGTLNRFGDSVLKVAMLLSLAREAKLQIDIESMNEAIEICEKLVGNMRRTTLGKQGISPSNVLKGMIINELLTRDNHQISRTVLMKKFWMHYAESNEFDEIMLSFESAGLIKIQSVGNQIIYLMPENQANELKRFMDGKN